MWRRSCAATASAEPDSGDQAFSRVKARPASQRQTAASPMAAPMPSTIRLLPYKVYTLQYV